MKIYLVDFENVKSKGLAGIDELDETDNVIIFYSENSDTISFEMHQKVLSSKAEVEYFKVNVGGKNALDFQLSTLLGYLVAKEIYSHIFVISNDRGFDFLHDFWHGKYVDSPATIVYRTRTVSAAVSFAKEEKTGTAVEEGLISEVIESTEAEIVQKPADNCISETTEITQTAEEIPTAKEVIKEEPVSQEIDVESIQEIQTKAETYMELLEQLLTPLACNKEVIATVSELILSSATKEELHNSLAKTYKQQATEFYKLLRPQYLKLKAKHEKEIPTPKEPVKRTESKAKSPRKTASKTAVENETPVISTSDSTEYHNMLSERLSQLLDNICTNEELNTITELFENATTKQQLYIRMVKKFKKEKGCEFYNAIRSEYSNLQKPQEK